MKVTQHVEHLLGQGRKPKELVELGFPKSVVTRVHRQLRQEKAPVRLKIPKGKADARTRSQASVASPMAMASIQQKLASLESALQKVDNLVKAMPELLALVAAAREFGTHKREDCPYLEDGHCFLYTWTEQGEIPEGIGEPVLVEEEKPRWYIKPSLFYCAMCSAPVEGRIDEVEDEVSGDPLAGAKYRITCERCGSRGLIAATLRCTKCGRETWRGWFPKQ